MEKHEKKIFPIKGSKVAGGNMYFEISFQGHEQDIKAFEFQRKNRPTQLNCIVKGFDDDGTPIFMQDIAAILPQIYTVGEVYEFRVKTDLIAGKYYDVCDWNGLMFRLNVYHHERLHINEMVRCRIKDIKLVWLDLELVSDHKRGIPLFTLEDFLALDSTGNRQAEAYIRYIFRHTPELSESRGQLKVGNALWVMNVAETVARNLTEWLNHEVKRDEPASVRALREKRSMAQRRAVLASFNSMCINLLENSSYLRDCSPREREEYQDRLNKIITHTGDYLKASNLIIEKRDRSYIDETLERLKLSGYLYNPEERMRVAMALFSLRKKSVSSYIDNILDIICESHSNTRFMHLFAKAFVEMLDMYISNESRYIDVLTGMTDRTAIFQMIKALSIRLLLTGNESASQRALYRSMLYRYATLVVMAGHEALVKKSLGALFESTVPMEFSWKDLDDLTLLCSKMTVSLPMSFNEPYVFEGNNALMTLNGGELNFTPLQMGENMKNGLPSNLFGHRKIRMLLNERMEEKIKSSHSDIMQFRLLWREIERSLFAKNQIFRMRPEGISPDVNDKVMIRITEKIPDRWYDYRAVIEDSTYSGEGVITPKQIVSYPIKPLSNTFKNDNGDYCLYEATVEHRDEDGTLYFNMREDIHEFLRESLEVGEMWTVQISMVSPDRYLCISEGGFSLFIYKDDVDKELKQGQFVHAIVEEIYPNCVIRASYAGETEETFMQTAAFKCLLDNYCGDNFYKEEDDDDIKSEAQIEDAKAASNYIEPDQMRELVHIIDREGMLQKNHIDTYNYLAVARIMSILLNDNHLADYFANRMELVETIQLFGDNGKIDEDRLDKLFSDNRDFISTYPDIEMRLTRLRIISQLDKTEVANWLWQLTQEAKDETTLQLARLVTSHIMLLRSNLFEVLNTIRTKIYRLMNLKVQIPDNFKVAEEDQTTELKTSVIYPAGNHMFPAEREQVTEILKVISSFLNTRGGRLYIGVDNSGYAVGLHTDFVYLNNRHENYDIADVKDKFDRLIRDAVHSRLGRVANGKISGSFETVGDKVIYRLDIEPSTDVIFVDGVAYERQGTSKWPIPAGEIPKFQATRASELG